MDRIMSVEEKIKRAEEIYARRHKLNDKNTATVHLQGKEKKDMKLFKKMFLQIIACLLIYLVFFTIRNNNYIFSEDFINKSNEILSYDINFEEIYNNVNNFISNLIENDQSINTNNNEENNSNNQENSENVEVNNENSEINSNENQNQGENTEDEKNNIGGSNERVSRRK